MALSMHGDAGPAEPVTAQTREPQYRWARRSAWLLWAVTLARCARAEGRTAEAEAGLRQALAILQRIGAANAADVSAELHALPGTPDPASASP